MRELLLGPKRFSDLRDSLPGISANVLTQRLEGLEEVSIVRRCRLPPPAASNVYELTEWGLESEEMIKVIGRWAARSPYMAEGKPMSVNSVILSFRTMFDAARAAGLSAVIGLRFGEDEFLARISGGALDISRDEADLGDAVLSCNQNALAAVVYGGVPLDKMIKTGKIKATGKLPLVKRFCKLFPLPETAPELVV
jgi:DNA-binding HxlR family transcriptional regulator